MDDIQRVEQIIDEAVTELEHAAEENADLEDVIGSFKEAVEVNTTQTKTKLILYPLVSKRAGA